MIYIASTLNSNKSECARCCYRLQAANSTHDTRVEYVGPYGEPSAQPGGILATPQKLAQEVRNSPTFKLVQSSSHNQCGTIPNNFTVTHWYFPHSVWPACHHRPTQSLSLHHSRVHGLRLSTWLWYHLLAHTKSLRPNREEYLLHPKS
jgi:hypothetical protein